MPNSLINKNFAFVFPGQGSQKIGMLSEIADHPLVKPLFESASNIVDQDLWKIIHTGPEELINQTQYTQPIMLTSDVAIWSIWREKNGFLPAMMAGHSLGEYAALVAACALSFEDAIQLVLQRARCMQEAVLEGEGAMAAILGLTNQQIIDICEQIMTDSHHYVEAANFNAPGQVVIGGKADSVERAMELAKESKAKRAKQLPMSIPSHCKLMQPASEAFRSYLENTSFDAPIIPIINNANVTFYEQANDIRENLARQLYCPVRWMDTVKLMSENGIDHIVECGPGKVLNGLNKRINKELKLFNLTSLENIENLL